MHCRRHGSKPTLALWMLVVVGNVVALVTGIGGPAALVIAGAIGVVAAATLTFCLLARRRGAASAEADPAAAVLLGREA